MNSANRETNEARLKEELNIALEKELDKAPDEIDVEKVDSLVKLLSRTADKEETGIRKREEFSSRFPGGYVRSKKKVYPVPAGVVRFAAAAVVFLLVFGVGNYVSVRATNRGILMNIKRQADTVLLQFIQKEEENYVNEGLQISPLSVEEKQYTGWEELITAEGLDILTPRFVPGGLELERLCVYVGDQIPWRIDARYRITENEEQFFIVSIINLEDKGSMSTSISSDNPEVTERSVGEKYVTFFRDVEGVQAMFQEEAYIYVIDTNLEMEVMEQFIETME